MTLLKLAGPALLLAALVGLCWFFEHRGYERAQAHYEPILAAARAEADVAEKRAKAAEVAAARVNQSIETEDKIRAEDAIRQRDAAVADRMRLAATLGRCRAVPSVPGGSSSTVATTRDDERLRAADEALGGLAYRCQRDADRLRGWQEWYRAIAASRSAPPTPPQ